MINRFRRLRLESKSARLFNLERRFWRGIRTQIKWIQAVRSTIWLQSYFRERRLCCANICAVWNPLFAFQVSSIHNPWSRYVCLPRLSELILRSSIFLQLMEREMHVELTMLRRR